MIDRDLEEILFEAMKLKSARRFSAIELLLGRIPRERLRENIAHALALANAWIFLYKHQDADALLLEVKDGCLASGDEALILRWQHDYASCLLFRGEISEANRLFQECLNKAEVLGDHRMIVWVNGALAVSASVQGEVDTAIRHYNRVFAAGQHYGFSQVIGSAHHNIGVVLREWGRYLEAASHFLLAEEYFEREGIDEELVFTRGERALAISKLGDFSLADRLARSAIAKLNAVGRNNYLAAGAHRVLGAVLVEHALSGDEEHVGEAKQQLTLAQTAASETRNPVIQADIHEELGVLALLEQRTHDAEKHRRAAVAIYERLFAEKHCHRLQQRFELVKFRLSKPIGSH